MGTRLWESSETKVARHKKSKSNIRQWREKWRKKQPKVVGSKNWKKKSKEPNTEDDKKAIERHLWDFWTKNRTKTSSKTGQESKGKTSERGWMLKTVRDTEEKKKPREFVQWWWHTWVPLWICIILSFPTLHTEAKMYVLASTSQLEQPQCWLEKQFKSKFGWLDRYAASLWKNRRRWRSKSWKLGTTRKMGRVKLDSISKWRSRVNREMCHGETLSPNEENMQGTSRRRAKGTNGSCCCCRTPYKKINGKRKQEGKNWHQANLQRVLSGTEVKGRVWWRSRLGVRKKACSKHKARFWRSGHACQ